MKENLPPIVYEVCQHPDNSLYVVVVWVDEDNHVNQGTLFAPWHLSVDNLSESTLPDIEQSLKDESNTRYRRDLLLIKQQLVKMALGYKTVGIEASLLPPFQGVVNHE